MRRTAQLAILFLFGITALSFGQVNSNFAPSSLHITWQLVDNYHQQEPQYKSILTLLNNGNRPIPGSGWSLYVNNLAGKDQTGKFEIKHTNGDLTQLIPTEQFGGLKPGEVLELDIISPGANLNVSGSPQGFYWVWDANPNEGIEVGPLSVEPVDDPQVLNRGPQDNIPTATPQTVFHQNEQVEDIPSDDLVPISPTPTNYKAMKGNFTLTADVPIVFAEEFRSEASYLANELSNLLDSPPPLTTKPVSGKKILLKWGKTDPEGYGLSITPETVTITGAQDAGIFYAIQSLKTAIPPSSWSQKSDTIDIPAMKVSDAPRFGHRAFMQDVARNFRTKEQILKTLDLMSLYKLNVFHFHFNDDEGWRIEIPGLPELTEVGARRGHTLTNHKRLQPSHGSGPQSSYPGSGYYSREDFIDILEFATERHIHVIPEIETAGHARAAIKAMDARYRRFMKEGNEEKAWQYLLQHPADSSEYRSVQGWDDNVMDVGLPSTYLFLEKVIDELAKMYDEAGAPLDRIHMGGDEVPAGAWEKSPAVKKLIAKEDNLESTDDLWGYFYRRVNSLLQERGLSLYGWEEIGMKEALWGGEQHAVPDTAFARQNVQVDVWNNVMGSGAEDLAYRLANAGYKVVLSGVSNFYFDLAYQKAFPEPGLYWGGFNSLDKPFSFIPYDYYKNVDTNVMGQRLTPGHFENMVRLTEQGRSNIVGIQGLLWAEKLISAERQEYMLMPKLLAMAERAWAAKPAWAEGEWSTENEQQYQRAWSQFLNVASKRELPRLDHYAGGVNYRIPTAGAVIKNGQLKANVQMPGFTIRYTTDGSDPTTQSTVYKGPVDVSSDATVKLKVFNKNGRGGRTVEVSNY